MDRLRMIGKYIKDGATTVKDKWQDSSTTTKAVIIGSATAVTAPLAIIPVLGAVGFTSAGVAAGSMAASWQTAATVSGSLFALCQSAGATGVVAATTSMGVGVTAGAAASGITAALCRKTESNGDNDEQDESGTEDKETQTEEPHTNMKEAQTQTMRLAAKTKKTQTKTEKKGMENKETQVDIEENLSHIGQKPTEMRNPSIETNESQTQTEDQTGPSDFKSNI